VNLIRLAGRPDLLAAIEAQTDTMVAWQEA
jgi:hypothetical protein